MTVALNGYTLNAVNEAANWSAVEYALLTAIVGKLPDAGATVTASSRHSHSLLVSPNAAIDPVLYATNTGDIYVANDEYIDNNNYLYFGTVPTEYGYIIHDGTYNRLIISSTDAVYISSTDLLSIVSAADILISIPATGGIGANTSLPNAVLEITDNGNANGRVVKITQDNEDVYGLVIGNDNAATDDDIGLTLIAMNNMSAEIKNTNNGALYIDTASGDIYLQIGNTTYLTVSAAGLVPSNNATIHIIAQNGAPTSTANGALWLDTDAGGANGTLKIYSNGDWRTVQDLN